jgi:hypothetical protein
MIDISRGFKQVILLTISDKCLEKNPVFYNFYTFADKPLLPIHMLSKWLLSLVHNLNLFIGLSLS